MKLGFKQFNTKMLKRINERQQQMLQLGPTHTHTFTLMIFTRTHNCIADS